jgi:precorrin-3B C17-methyltransferase
MSLVIVGLGPGGGADLTERARAALEHCTVLAGYSTYVDLVRHQFPDKWILSTPMRKEEERCRQALEWAQREDVAMVCSGDPGVYGMAGLCLELAEEYPPVEIEIISGVTAATGAASVLGAPLTHDFAVVSLSDLMTPWEVIERRIKAASEGDFVTAIYNPKSHGRYWQLYRLVELFLQVRSAETPVGYVRQAGRDDEEIKITTLGAFDPEDIDMFTVILIGNSQTYISEGKMITPRGYYREEKENDVKPGQQIMMESFRTIASELKRQDYPLDHKWALLHAIHTTADFDMEDILYTDEGAVDTLYNKVKEGTLTTIITDVTMVTSGIRKGALQRLGIEAKCYLSDPRVAEIAATQGITRTQAGIRLAVEEYPDALFAFGNAPTALMELCDLIRKGKAHPAGIIAAPVGFVHVKESKHMVKPFKDIPKIIVEGRKGGSNLAATLCNAILTFDDAEQLKPGRDL